MSPVGRWVRGWSAPAVRGGSEFQLSLYERTDYSKWLSEGKCDQVLSSLDNIWHNLQNIRRCRYAKAAVLCLERKLVDATAANDCFFFGSCGRNMLNPRHFSCGCTRGSNKISHNKSLCNNVSRQDVSVSTSSGFWERRPIGCKVKKLVGKVLIFFS